MITPTDHDKNEWSRLARDAYAKGINSIGHRYSAAAAMRNGESCTVEYFDRLQSLYRAWLIDGFKNLV